MLESCRRSLDDSFVTFENENARHKHFDELCGQKKKQGRTKNLTLKCESYYHHKKLSKGNEIRFIRMGICISTTRQWKRRCKSWKGIWQKEYLAKSDKRGEENKA